jgi:hypothetical protein
MKRRLKVVMPQFDMEKLEKELDENLRTRVCGECTACCTVMGVEEIEKPAGEPCQHICDKGCAIYGSHPKACQDFLCAWKTGFDEMARRPDKSGLVGDIMREDSPAHPGVIFREVWPGAFDENKERIDELASKVVVFLVRGNLPRKMLGPEHRMVAMRKYIAQIKAAVAKEKANEEGHAR